MVHVQQQQQAGSQANTNGNNGECFNSIVIHFIKRNVRKLMPVCVRIVLQLLRNRYPKIMHRLHKCFRIN